MRLVLTKYEYTVQTIIIVPLTRSPLWLLFLVSLGDCSLPERKNRDFFFCGAPTTQRIRRFTCLQDCLLTLTCHLTCIVNLCGFYFYKTNHRETHRFFSTSGVQADSGSWTSSASGIYQWSVPLPPRDVILTSQIQDWEHSHQDCRSTDCIEYWWSPVPSKSHTHPSHSQTSRLLTFRCSSPPHNPVYVRRVDPSALAFGLSSHRHSYISLLFTSRFIAQW